MSITSGDSSGSAWRKSCGLLLGLLVCRGLVALCVLPPFEGWDEYQHVGYVAHVEAGGERPVLGETCVPADALAGIVRFPQSACALRDQLGQFGAVGYATYWEKPDTPTRYRGETNPLYQSQHGPWYYRLAAPVFRACGGVGNLRASVAALRLVNVLLTVASVGVVLVTLRRVVRREADAPLLALALAAHPLFLFNGARVANDALGVFLATVAVALGFRMVLSDGRRTIGYALAVGLTVGLAIAVKSTNFGLIPFAAFVWLAATVRRKLTPGRSLVAGLAMAAACLIVVQDELRFNFAHYGLPTSMQEAVINHRKGLGPAALAGTAATIPWSKALVRLWNREFFFTGGWSFLPTHPKALRYYRDAITAGLLGWAWFAAASMVARLRGVTRLGVFASAWVPVGCGVLVAGYTAALGYHMVQSKTAWGVSTTNAWYASPALPWFLALVSAGGMAWPLGRWLRPLVPAALAGACLAGEVIGVWGRMVPLYSGNATGLEALRRLATLQPVGLGTVTLVLALAVEVVIVASLVLIRRDAVLGSETVRSERLDWTSCFAGGADAKWSLRHS